MATAPRLIVGPRPRPEIDEALAAQLPDVPWIYWNARAGADLGSAAALLVGSVDRELADLNSADLPGLAFVQRLYTGLDAFPFSKFPASVQVAGNVGGMAAPVAEHAIALALAAARSIVAGNRMVAAGKLRPAPEMISFQDRTALILGYGSIGREISRRLEGFGVRRVGLNRTGTMGPDIEAVFPADRLDEALAEADLVFDARPLTLGTRASLGAAQWAHMRPEAIYVNVGRAGVVEEEALYQHLVAHPKFRVALDVWWSEDYVGGTLGQRFAWTDLPNFVGTPHCAAGVPGAERFALRKAIENLRRFFDGQTPRFLANRSEYPT